MSETMTLRRPDDFHLHLRDGEMLQTVLAYSARQFARVIVMPNLKPPVTRVADARAYRERILAALTPGQQFEPLMTAGLCDDTPADELRRGFEEGVFTAAKLYPAGATTHSEFGVTSIARVARALDAMQALGMPLLVHGESTDPAVDVFDREAVFIETTLQPLLKDFPALKLVMEHITTEEAVDFIGSDISSRLAATVTPQHLMFNRNALFTGGLRPHQYCLPALKRERHRLALRHFATSGSPKVFLGRGLGAAPAQAQGGDLRLRRDLQCTGRLAELPHGLRRREGPRQVRGLRQHPWCTFLRLAFEWEHTHAAQGVVRSIGRHRTARWRQHSSLPGRQHAALDAGGRKDPIRRETTAGDHTMQVGMMERLGGGEELF